MPAWAPIEGGEAHLVTPVSALLRQPHHGFGAGPAEDHVEELATSDVDQLVGELLAVPWSASDHQHLVESQSLDCREPVGVIDQSFSIGDDCLVAVVPVAPKFLGYLVDAAGTPAHLRGDPPTDPVGHGQPGPGDAVILLGPAAIRAVCVRTTPRDERHDPLVLQVGTDATLGTSRPQRPTLDINLERWSTVVDAEHVDLEQAHEDLAYACRALFGWPAEVLTNRERVMRPG